MKITDEHWDKITAYYPKLIKSSMFCSIASVDAEGHPNVTPIGTVFFNNDKTGFYFDMHTKALSKNIENNPEVCLLFVNTSKLFWFKSLLRNKFTQPSGFKLMGRVGKKRQATEAEKTRFEKMIRRMRKLKGYQTLWANHEYVREISFFEYFPIQTGEMTRVI
jgi:predicted pyridoxine 5'-phosphate oxidase superfamily flavin-nucleotide-binding protein